MLQKSKPCIYAACEFFLSNQYKPKLVLIKNKGFHIQNQNDLIFRRKNDEIVIKRYDGKTLSFPNAKKAWHSSQNGEDTVVVVTAMGSKTRVNKSLS